MLAFLVGIFFAGVLIIKAPVVFAQDETAVPSGCTNLSDPVQCPPPGIQLVEVWVIKGIYILWGFGGLMFAFGLAAIGFAWLTSGGDPQKLEELKKKATYWAISIPVFFGGLPVILLILQVLPIASNACYEELNTPGFHIIFPDACSDLTLPDNLGSCSLSNDNELKIVSSPRADVCYRCDGSARQWNVGQCP